MGARHKLQLRTKAARKTGRGRVLRKTSTLTTDSVRGQVCDDCGGQ